MSPDAESSSQALNAETFKGKANLIQTFLKGMPTLLALVVIPELRISDMGLIDVRTFEKVDLFV